MAISTDSIIHYTNKLEIIRSILKEGFHLKYCVEELLLGTGKSKAAHPMVSFCDIPLSDSMQHFDAYGKYGIGLSKVWAMKNGINPVIYIDKDSLIAANIYELIKERRIEDTNLTKKQKKEILQIKSYAKNYSGPLERGKVKNKNYRFYDEREWRLIPSKGISDARFSIKVSSFLKDKNKYNNKISDYRLPFKPEDISYIIVKKASEIHSMITFLREEFSNKYTSTELDILFSKICSTEQIISDF